MPATQQSDLQSPPTVAATMVEGITMTERGIINKYTLVPVGAVITAVLMTIGVMSYVGNDHDRILILETQSVQLQKENADLRFEISSMNDKLDAQTVSIADLGKQLAVIASKLDNRP